MKCQAQSNPGRPARSPPNLLSGLPGASPSHYPSRTLRARAAAPLPLAPPPSPLPRSAWVPPHSPPNAPCTPHPARPCPSLCRGTLPAGPSGWSLAFSPGTPAPMSPPLCSVVFLSGALCAVDPAARAPAGQCHSRPGDDDAHPEPAAGLRGRPGPGHVSLQKLHSRFAEHANEEPCHVSSDRLAEDKQGFVSLSLRVRKIQPVCDLFQVFWFL